MTIAAADRGIADAYVIGEAFEPLAAMWSQIIADPDRIAAAYACLWREQALDPRRFFDRVRDEFNRQRDPARLLYLLARCVKNSPRFDAKGQFNQSPDNRRRGMRPAKMHRELVGAARLLAGRTNVRAVDYCETIAEAGPDDLVYLDPPWQGTSSGPDKRYHSGLRREQVLAMLNELKERNVAYLLSYDGRRGSTTYGEPLPEVRFELVGGRSSQATLNGRAEITVESLYVSTKLLRAEGYAG